MAAILVLLALGLVLIPYLGDGRELANGHVTTLQLSLAGDLVLLFGLLVATAIIMRGRAGPDPAASGSGSISAGTVVDTDTVLQLLRDKEAAEAANAAKSRYLAHVSHEIRAPLNAIYGYAQLVEREEAISPHVAAQVIRRSAEHLTNLVEGLLDISAVENGVLRLSSDTVRFRAFIDQTVSMFRPEAAGKGLEFRCELPDRLPEYVRIDQKRVRQVLINLLSNAIKFTATGSVTLRVSYAGQVALFEVIDTGPGIPREDLDRLLMPFERGVGVATRGQPGFGLGLAISNALVQILGGQMEVASEVGRGTTFGVRLMLGHSIGPLVDSSTTRRVSGYAGERRSILIADDDIQQLTLMRCLLEGLGFLVAAAPNGRTAVALAETQRFDLAVLDISMPELNGWETAAALRAAHGHAIRIVMLSGNAHERDVPTGEEPVHDRFIVKPFEIDDVVDVIGTLLGLEWTWAKSAQDTVPAQEQGMGGDRQPAVTIISPDAMLIVDAMRQLVRIGHVRGIEAQIKAFAEAAPEQPLLTARMFACLDRFDLTALADLLNELNSENAAEP